MVEVQTVIPAGRRVRVEVPATSANLGPGFDCLGLALDWRDTSEFETVTRSGGEPRVRVEITGEGAGTLPADERNLIVRSLDRGLQRVSSGLADDTGLLVRVRNTIPQGRGLGSSSAAIVAGLAGAHALTSEQPFDPADWLGLADRIEGHPDNVAAALFGGLVLAYRSVEDGVAAVTSPVHPAVAALALVPEAPLTTEVARAALPATVPHGDAAANAGRAALLVHALTRAPELLFEATADWLHQSYRAASMPASAELLESLRSKGIPAVISGAGPTVLVLGDDGTMAGVQDLVPEGFRAVTVAVGHGARVL